jgi:hypothetical protein
MAKGTVAERATEDLEFGDETGGHAPVAEPPDAVTGSDEVGAADTGDQQEADDMADLPEDGTADDDPVVPSSLDRHRSPSAAIAAYLGRRVQEHFQTIEGGIWDDRGDSWNGVKVVTAADIIAIWAEPLPEPSVFSSEVRSGGSVVAWTHCPNCGIANPIHVDVGSELKMNDEGDRKLKPTFKAEAKAHRCGQQVLPLQEDHGLFAPTADASDGAGEEVAANDDATPAGTGAMAATTDGADVPTVEAVGALLDAVADKLPDVASIDLPPDEEIAEWDAATLLEVATWATAVVEATGPYPDLPSVLAAQDDRAAENEPATLADGVIPDDGSLGED